MNLNNVKNIFIYQLAFITSNIISLIFIPIFTRILSPQEYGIIALIVALPLLINSFLSGGVSYAIPRYYFKYRNDTDKVSELFFSNGLFLLAGFLVGLPIIFFFRKNLAMISMGSENYGWAFFCAFINSFVFSVVTLYLNLYQNMEKAWKYCKYNISYFTISNVLGLVFIWKFSLSYIGIIYAQLFTSVALFFLMTADFIYCYPFKFNMQKIIETLKYGIPILPKNISGMINKYFDKYLIMGMLSLSGVGIYNIGQNLGNKLFIMMGAIYFAFYPFFMKEIFDKGEDAATSLGRNFTYFAYLSLGSILLIILFSKEIFSFLVPPAYWSSINVFLIVSLGVSTQTFGKFIGVQMSYAKKAYYFFPISLMGLAVNILLNIFLIPRWGILGAAVAFTITIIITNITLINLAQHFYKVLYEWKNLGWFYFLLLLTMFQSLFYFNFAYPFIVSLGIRILLVLSFLLAGVHAKIITRDRIRFFYAIGIKKINERFASKKIGMK